jgi:hypothetical protein
VRKAKQPLLLFFVLLRGSRFSEFRIHGSHNIVQKQPRWAERWLIAQSLPVQSVFVCCGSSVAGARVSVELVVDDFLVWADGHSGRVPGLFVNVLLPVDDVDDGVIGEEVEGLKVLPARGEVQGVG